MKYTFLFVFIILFFTNNLIGQETNAFLSGKVVNEKNLPMCNVNIKIILIPLNKICNTTTNKKGIFNVPNLYPGGPYVIEATLDGYVKTKKEISQLELGRNDMLLYIQPEFKKLSEK